MQSVKPICPDMYTLDEQSNICVHYFLPPDLLTVVGFVMTFVVAGFSSLAGLGSGTAHLVIVLSLYNYIPKQSTIVIFSCIMGTTLGNVLCKMNRKLNGQSIIQYSYSFVSIPVMFMASIVGVLLNKLLPTLAVCTFILYMAITSLKSIYQRFVTAYQQETKQNNTQNGVELQENTPNPTPISKKQEFVESEFDPFTDPQYRYVFKNLGCLFLVYIGISLTKGTEKFESLIGLKKCSFAYWLLYIVLFAAMGFFSYSNLKTLNKWTFGLREQQLGGDSLLNEQQAQRTQTVNENISFVVKMSVYAGLFGGFGLGGGMFLVPMYKKLGLNSIQAASTCAFSLLITSVMNSLQGIFLGIIHLSDFFFLFSVSLAGSYSFSLYITKELQKRNRTSLVEAVLLVLVLIALVNIPLALFLKYQRSNYDSQVLLGFGTLC